MYENNSPPTFCPRCGQKTACIFKFVNADYFVHTREVHNKKKQTFTRVVDYICQVKK